MERKQRIYDTLYRAAEACFSALFREHPAHYYYAALILLDAQTLCITAMSEEVLAERGSAYKWSYADSPYTGFAHKRFFAEVSALYQQDIWDASLSDEALERRVADWRRIMRKVMQDLSENGLFSAFPDLFRNAEYYPPEGSINRRNAKKLNSPAVYKSWLKENPDCDEPEEPENIYEEVYHPKLCKVLLVKPLPSKALAVSLRKDFASPCSLHDFVSACAALPFEISAAFRYKEALALLSAHPEYQDILSVQLLPQK